MGGIITSGVVGGPRVGEGGVLETMVTFWSGPEAPDFSDPV